jgi:cytidyltransferase-like protein
MKPPKKIYRYPEDTQILSETLAGRSTVLAGGCFDILHYGHLMFLKNASALGDVLVLILESDEFIRARKKREPIHTQYQRAEILSHIDMVDAVIMIPLFTRDADYYNLVEFIRPATIVLTQGDPQLKKKKEQADRYNSRLVTIDQYKGFSSSAIHNYASLSRD